MGISLYNIKKWTRMLSGNSIYHVNQGVGKNFDINEIRGYYNDLTEKVTKTPELMENHGFPVLETPDGKKVEFAIGIFQYGLGAYDLYLQTNEEKYLVRFRECIDWAMEHQQENGSWDSFSHKHPDYPYSAMAQGEGASLLIRGHKAFGEEKYLKAAIAAVDFMLLPVEEGGTAIYKDGSVFLAEVVCMPVVLNGWIFALWGLLDCVIATGNERYSELLELSYKSLEEYLPKFSRKYWSMYSLDHMIASPFYHNLHVAQLEAMYKITGNPLFKEYSAKWHEFSNNKLYKTKAFIKKAFQKIME
ncbi:MAG: thioredoxin [Clostridia bacterium]|nr:thioredoxin [Clostridia bacterium]